MNIKKQFFVNDYIINYIDFEISSYWITIELFGKQNGYIKAQIQKESSICEILELRAEESSSLKELLLNPCEQTKEMVETLLNYISIVYSWITEFRFKTQLGNINVYSDVYLLNFYYVLFTGGTILETRLGIKAKRGETDYFKYIDKMNNVELKEQKSYESFKGTIRDPKLPYRKIMKKLYKESKTFLEFSKSIINVLIKQEPLDSKDKDDRDDRDKLFNTKWISDYFMFIFNEVYLKVMACHKYINRSDIVKKQIVLKEYHSEIIQDKQGYEIL